MKHVSTMHYSERKFFVDYENNNKNLVLNAHFKKITSFDLTNQRLAFRQISYRSSRKSYASGRFVTGAAEKLLIAPPSTQQKLHVVRTQSDYFLQLR